MCYLSDSSTCGWDTEYLTVVALIKFPGNSLTLCTLTCHPHIPVLITFIPSQHLEINNHGDNNEPRQS
ncbi:hypothetical protein CBL_10373 [Carabus blaptoides fortunei]